jgi:hypothetical protein
MPLIMVILERFAQQKGRKRRSRFVCERFVSPKFCSWLYNLGEWEKEDDSIFHKPHNLLCYVSKSMRNELVMRSYRGDEFWEIGFKLMWRKWRTWEDRAWGPSYTHPVYSHNAVKPMRFSLLHRCTCVLTPVLRKGNQAESPGIDQE